VLACPLFRTPVTNVVQSPALLKDYSAFLAPVTFLLPSGVLQDASLQIRLASTVSLRYFPEDIASFVEEHQGRSGSLLSHSCSWILQCCFAQSSTSPICVSELERSAC